MVSLLQMLLRTAIGRSPKLACDSGVWNRGVEELNRRTGGTRESGAFLLGKVKGRMRKIEQFLYYDDVDPTCFHHGTCMSILVDMGRVPRIVTIR